MKDDTRGGRRGDADAKRANPKTKNPKTRKRADAEKKPRKKKCPRKGVSEQAAVNQARAMELRRRGWGFSEIAADLQVSLSTAHGYVSAALAELAEQTKCDAEHLRALELARIEDMERRWLPVAMAYGKTEGELEDEVQMEAVGGIATVRMKAVDRVIKLREQRHKLLGLYQEVKAAGEGRVLTLEDLAARRKLATGGEDMETRRRGDAETRR